MILTARDAISKNPSWIVQFHSKDDHLVPYSEARFVSNQIKSDYKEYDDFGHFQEEELPILVEAIQHKLK